MQPPIGVSNFKKLIEHRDFTGLPYLFVDKSLFIKALLEDSTEVKLITRPRRFGKTLNMSMLHHFFANTVDNQPTKQLFNGLKISEHDACMQYQGQYPVIFLSFKDIKSSSFNSAYEDFCNLLSQAYEQHEEVLLGSKLTDRQKNKYRGILNRSAPEMDIRCALKDLTLYLHQSYGVKPIVLIDEYDTPIQTAYIEKYYKEMVVLMREFLGAGLKDNAHLDRAVLTGILRVSKESLFSGLNNIKTYTLLNDLYGEYFGFTEDEVAQLLTKSDLLPNLNEVRDWYNGYKAGSAVIYNPWSIVNYIKEHGKLGAYWVNTSDNLLIKDLLIRSSTAFKAQFEKLLQDKSIEMLIDEHVAFNNLDASNNLNTSEPAVWTLLLMTGYLKATFIRNIGKDPLCQLQVPNKEVQSLYQTLIAEWLSGNNNAMVFNTLLNNLLNGNMKDFEGALQDMMLQTFSTHDVQGDNPEKFYHGLMLGIISGIDRDHYTIDSNKESGLGRYDIMLIPNDPRKLGVILEFKNIKEDSSRSLTDAAQDAIQQIDDKKYNATLFQNNVKSCLKVGIAFKGKELAITHRIDS